jgi:hypothetical protein
MSALDPLTDSTRTSRHVRDVPKHIKRLMHRSIRAYSITSSARASSVSGIVTPSACWWS